MLLVTMKEDTDLPDSKARGNDHSNLFVKWLSTVFMHCRRMKSALVAPLKL